MSILPKQFQVQCNPYQNPKYIFTEIEKKHPKIPKEAQKIPNRQSNFE